ncbi:leukocidin family pore-forming toxin [Silvanigrella aquatica]|uniref:Uncharacterized protein n=1 Tax=Silvanigrella aquatica TaxID=1915309 RepID=A0A1L4D1X8_9BACT|nr:leukocidin family pore-forming toxin [Silvanigrella aquatica]APJ04202.1 hypothetical protein AXG55_09905 [Silvanigrella aquatica]
MNYKSNIFLFFSIFYLNFVTSCGKFENDDNIKYNNQKNFNSVLSRQLILSSIEDIKNNNINEKYDENEIIVMDLRNKFNSDELLSLMGKLGGLQIYANYVIIKKTIEGSHYTVLQDIPTAEELNSLLIKINNKNSNRKKTNKVGFDPEKNFLNSSVATVTLLARNRQCPMRKFYQTKTTNYDEKRDYCNSKAFVELNYKIDMSGSKATLKEDLKTGRIIKTENGKYLMITVSPTEEGGTGWHLTNQIHQEHNWFESWANRWDFVGPFANKYQFWIRHLNKTEGVRLVETFPQNTNPESNVVESHGVTVGLSGALKGGIDSKGLPSANVDLGTSVQIADRRDVSFKTQEYTVENESYDNNAIWAWNAKVNEKLCDYLTRKDISFCYFTGFLWDTSWTSNKNKFSALSHKSFTPSFQAIYKAKKEVTDISTFEVGTNVETGVIIGSIVPIVAVSLFRTVLDTYTMPSVSQVLSVDWSSPYFASEQNIRLQNMSDINNTKCLTVSINGRINQERCKESRSQVWGYDNDEKIFKTRLIANSCLTLNSNNELLIKECSMDNNQKWILNKEGFIQLYSNKTKVIGQDKNGELKLFHMDSQKGTVFEAFQAKL